MRKIALFTIIALLSFYASAQQMYEVQLGEFETMENYNRANAPKAKLLSKKFTIVMGGLNDLDGIGNYLNIYGSKLIVERLDQKSDGSKHVVLRREDGLNFYDRYPTVTARLTPVRHLHHTTKALR